MLITPVFDNVKLKKVTLPIIDHCLIDTSLMTDPGNKPMVALGKHDGFFIVR